MSPTVHRILATLLAGAGLLVAAGYAAAIALSADRYEATVSYGSLAGLGFFAVAFGVFWFAVSGRPRLDERLMFRTPPLWLSGALFLALVGVGYGLRVADVGAFVSPLLAVGAFAAVTAFFLRLVANWMPRRRLAVDNVIGPGLWGAFLTPLVLLAIQGAAVMLLVFSAFVGFVAADQDFELDPNLEERITEYVDDMDSSGATMEVPDVVTSPTIAVALTSLIAVIAPLSEELLKALGPIILLSRRATVTRSDAFIAGAAAGLGFGIIEGVGYTLGSPPDWQQMIVVRAPVVAMHVAATTIVTLGWFRYRETGRGLLPYFAVGTALHAGWNAMAIGFVYALIGVGEGADPSAGEALAILGVIALLGVLFVTACAWLITSARAAGRAEQYNDGASTPMASAAPS